MLRGPLGKAKYKPKFSGHDTFPFRYAWLTKVAQFLEGGDLKKIKEFEKYKLQTMSEFGVGLNMVKSMRHWSQVTKICDKNFELTDFGKFVFSKKKAADPYLEKNETLWLLHWMIASDSNLTTWFYLFNYHPSIIVNREQVINELLQIGKFSKWKGISPNTIKRDVDCFIRTYLVSHKKGEITEDSIECPLAELGLLQQTYTKNEFELHKGPKSSLTQSIFEFALHDYWSKQKNQIITFEKLMYDYGSPGKVFQLDEKSLEEYLDGMSQSYNKIFQFDKGAGGLRQISKIKNVKQNQLLSNCYRKVA
tara:strand:- start:3830 stop:4750 length:921 start_codon:yes stop_codon:yes gene_type:complete